MRSQDTDASRAPKEAVVGLVRVILTGTDPHNPTGGIGVAMQGSEHALLEAGLLDRLVPSYRPGSLRGRLWLMVQASLQVAVRCRGLRRQGLTPVVYAHGGAGFGLVRQSVVLATARVCGARTMLQLHSITVDARLRSRAGRTFLRICMAPADTVCVLTQWWQHRLGTVMPDVTVRVVPNALSPDLERRARSKHTEMPGTSEAGPLRVLAMSRLERGKGVDVLLRAAARLDFPFALVVAGEGPERRRLQSLATELDLADRVEFVGWVSGDVKEAVLAQTDVFCLPTTHDSFCMSFLDAMARGLPIVGARFGPIPDIVLHELGGLLVEGPDVEGVARALTRLRDPELRRRLGEGGREWALSHFSAATVGRSITEAVRSSLREP